MAEETAQGPALLKVVTDLVADFADLFQKELKLAKAEIADNTARMLRAGLWMSVAGALGLLACLFVLQAIVFALIDWGLAPHWACLVVALALAIIALGLFLKGRGDVRNGLAPERALNQIKRDIESTKEQLT